MDAVPHSSFIFCLSAATTANALNIQRENFILKVTTTERNRLTFCCIHYPLVSYALLVHIYFTNCDMLFKNFFLAKFTILRRRVLSQRYPQKDSVFSEKFPLMESLSARSILLTVYSCATRGT